MADSLDAAVQAARRYTREAPGSADAWYHLADALMYQGDAEQAYAAERVAAPLDSPERARSLRGLIALQTEDWKAAEDYYAREADRAEKSLRERGTWWMIVIRRNQGRLAEALEIARAYIADGGIRSPEAQVLFEQGEHASAARAFRAIANAPPANATPSRRAREIAWYLTHTATALAAGGDTSSLLMLADSVEVLGRQTAYGRDRRLHHHVRGLLYAARGRRDEAIESFERAIFSPTSGYTRTNYELARVLIDAGRPRDAIRVLRPIFHGGLEASNLYLTRTDVHALLGRAFELADQPDSAVTHYRKAISSWEQADAPVAVGRRALEERVVSLIGQ